VSETTVDDETAPDPPTGAPPGDESHSGDGGNDGEAPDGDERIVGDGKTAGGARGEVEGLRIEPTVAAEPGPDRPAEPAIRIRGLTKRYGDVFAVRDLNLDIPKGSVFGLIGPNGAGKTTTFSILASLLKPTAGSAWVLGHDPSRQPREVRKRMGYMPDVLGVYDGLRVGEYLEFFAAAYLVPKASWKATVEGLLELVDLTTKRDAMVNSLSRGMKQRLSLARALVHDPEVLVLDEPASGLDPRARVELRNLLRELREMGKTIVVSSHILSELAEMCTEIGIMEKGRLLAAGTPGQISYSMGAGRQIRVRLAGGTERTYTVSDDDEQAALLRKLLDEGQTVLEFAQVGDGLEELFMQITTGEVQ
jgi:ABC-2 type transport system ATP-binding protein